MSRLFVVLLLLAARRDSAWVPRHEYLRQAQVVVAGEVIDFENDSKGREFALLKPTIVLKGKCTEYPIKLPVMKQAEVGCDDRIPYGRGYKFIILMDERLPSRAIPHGSYRIDDLEGGEIAIVQVALDVLDGHADRRIDELLRMIESPTVKSYVKRDVCELVRILSRKEARPLLAAVRKAYGPWGYIPGAWAKQHEGSSLELDRMYRLPELVDTVLDLSLVPELLKGRHPDEDKLLQTLSHVCGHSFSSRRAFDEWWAKALERSRANGTPKHAEAYLPLLRSPDPVQREEASRMVLDLGPSIQSALEPYLKDSDAEVRARAAELMDELLILRDIREELRP